jgi:hypothetical protein
VPWIGQLRRDGENKSDRNAILPRASLIRTHLALFNSSMRFVLVVAIWVLASFARAQQPPGRPAPFFSWDTIPRAFHGANKSGLFTNEAISQLSYCQMVTLEKWYTPCASQGPIMSGPSCDVEQKTFGTFSAIRNAATAGGRNISINLYFNSMFNFDFYAFAGTVFAAEAAGEKLLLRDHRGELVLVCNDGDFYCNVTTYDHTVAAMRNMWVGAVVNATTSVGAVNGLFADHYQNFINPGPGDGSATTATYCNGSPETCWNFTNDFASKLVTWPASALV